MLNLPAVLNSEIFKSANSEGLVWLIAMIADESTTATVVFQFCSDREPVVFDTKTYYPFPFSAISFEQDSDGTPIRALLSVSNVTGEIAHYLDVGDGFLNHDVEIRLAHMSHLSGAANSIVLKMKIQGISGDPRAVTFELGFPDLIRYRFPRNTYQRNRCRYRFTDLLCQFIRPTVGQPGYGDPNIMFCDKTLEGPAGCQVHGLNEIDRNIGKIHPGRYGGQPSIPEEIRV